MARLFAVQTDLVQDDVSKYGARRVVHNLKATTLLLKAPCVLQPRVMAALRFCTLFTSNPGPAAPGVEQKFEGLKILSKVESTHILKVIHILQIHFGVKGILGQQTAWTLLHV